MYWWSDFDAAEVREEFSLIRDLGLGLVRLFLLWDDWQPTPETVSPAALDHFEVVADIAAGLGLGLDVTFFTGHMSGPSWAPQWLLRRDYHRVPFGVWQVVSRRQVVNCGYRNPYADPLVLEAEELLLHTVVGCFHDHPAIHLWNLGNEPDLFARPPSPLLGQAWARRMTSIIHALDPVHPVTCGLHVNSLILNNGLRVHDVFGETDLAVMHGYPMYAFWAGGPLDPDFVPYVCALTAALSGKPTMMEEFGGCTSGPGRPSATWWWRSYGWPRWQFMASEADLAAYLERVLPGLVEVGATGALLWCFADYAVELWDRPPCDQMKHERFFGLVRPDGSLKPHADVVRRFAATAPTVAGEPQRRVKLDLTPDEFYRAPLRHTRRLYRQFRAKR
jgi:endo-1,4-beta-mannosidase